MTVRLLPFVALFFNAFDYSVHCVYEIHVEYVKYCVDLLSVAQSDNFTYTLRTWQAHGDNIAT
jgi:hypothetical protein